MPLHNVALPPLPFVGRETELAHIIDLFADPACRLLTLTGPGGIGKTRLAQEAARQLTFPDGTYFIPLQALNSPDLLVSAIADGIDFKFHPGGNLQQQLLHYLGEKSLLLVLDNMEHLLDGVQLLSEILQADPNISILATSRERLDLREEWVLEVGELSSPVDETEADVERYSAIELFIQHARRANVRFTLTDAQTPAVIRICRMVGGMPLGIELAAAWVRVLSCEAIAEEIAHSLDILEASTVNMEPRHRSMRATIEPTWERLTDEERRVFKKLSVFRGSFTREAARLVANASLRTLTALVDKSLVQVDGNGRYDLHELLRQYAKERLNDVTDEAALTHDRHCSYHAHFLESQWPRLTGSEIKSAMQEINIELENVRAAWNWAVSHRKAEAIEAMLDSLRLFYDTDYRYQEGEQVFASAVSTLKASAPEQTNLWAKVLARQGALSFVSQPAKSNALLRESLVLVRRFGTRNDLAFALYRLWFVTREDGTPKRIARLEESLALYKDMDDQWGMGQVLGLLCESYLEEGYLQDNDELLRQAQHYAQESLALYQRFNSLYGIAHAYMQLGSAACRLEEYQQAYNYYQKSSTIFQDIDIRWGILYSLAGLGEVACAQGKYADARRFELQALQYLFDYSLPGDSLFALIPLCVTAEIWLGEGNIERAYELLALVEQQRQKIGYPKKWIEFRLLSRLDEELPLHLAAAAERGKAQNVVTIIKVVMCELERVEDAIPRHSCSQPLADPLTERESEILSLMADGLNSREIAQQLVLSVGTIRWYLKHIYSKLNVHSRSQAIARARELNLLI